MPVSSPALMRIGVNLMFLVPGEVGGSEPLLTNLVLAMANDGADLTVFAVKGFVNAYPEIAERTEVIEVPWSSGAQGLRVAAEQTWLQWQAVRRKLDVVHHGVGTTPFVKIKPEAVTLHDIQYRHFPENFVRPKRWWLSLNVAQTLRRTESICVPSNWVKQDVESKFRMSKDKVDVIPFGSEGLFGNDPADADEVRRRYRLDREYFFFPGRAYPHKNHRFLIEAFEPLSDQADLVFSGPPWFTDRDVEAAVRAKGLTGRVRHLGVVPRRDLAGLFQGAVALLYPTLFEGFGAPVLEAMSAGCPVISSNRTAVPEVVGDAGILLEPNDIHGWRETMEQMLSDSAARQNLVSLGTARARNFSWSRSARLQLAAYQKALR